MSQCNCKCCANSVTHRWSEEWTGPLALEQVPVAQVFTVNSSACRRTINPSSWDPALIQERQQREEKMEWFVNNHFLREKKSSLVNESCSQRLAIWPSLFFAWSDQIIGYFPRKSQKKPCTWRELAPTVAGVHWMEGVNKIQIESMSSFPRVS